MSKSRHHYEGEAHELSARTAHRNAPPDHTRLERPRRRHARRHPARRRLGPGADRVRADHPLRPRLHRRVARARLDHDRRGHRHRLPARHQRPADRQAAHPGPAGDGPGGDAAERRQLSGQHDPDPRRQVRPGQRHRVPRVPDLPGHHHRPARPALHRPRDHPLGRLGDGPAVLAVAAGLRRPLLRQQRPVLRPGRDAGEPRDRQLHGLRRAGRQRHHRRHHRERKRHPDPDRDHQHAPRRQPRRPVPGRPGPPLRRREHVLRRRVELPERRHPRQSGHLQPPGNGRRRPRRGQARPGTGAGGLQPAVVRHPLRPVQQLAPAQRHRAVHPDLVPLRRAGAE